VPVKITPETVPIIHDCIGPFPCKLRNVAQNF
jgi:hypothetical protein